MKIETDHRFYAPTFQALADILDKDYEIKYDNTDKELDLSLTVVHKKYKSHGIHIRTHLGPDPEWRIGAYVNLPIETNYIPNVSFKPHARYDTEYGQFPMLAPDQIRDLTTKIKKIAKVTLEVIQEELEQIDSLQMSKDDINFYYEDGFEVMKNFKNYGVDVDYEEFLLQPRKDMLLNWKIVQGVYNSKIPEIRRLMQLAIDMYIEELRMKPINDAIKFSDKFMTVSGGVVNEFTDDNNRSYLEMVKSMFDGVPEDPEDKEIMMKKIVSFIRTIDRNKSLVYMINEWAYEMTQDEHFLSQEAKDIFLF